MSNKGHTDKTARELTRISEGTAHEIPTSAKKYWANTYMPIFICRTHSKEQSPKSGNLVWRELRACVILSRLQLTWQRETVSSLSGNVTTMTARRGVHQPHEFPR